MIRCHHLHHTTVEIRSLARWNRCPHRVQAHTSVLEPRPLAWAAGRPIFFFSEVQFPQVGLRGIFPRRRMRNRRTADKHRCHDEPCHGKRPPLQVDLFLHSFRPRVANKMLGQFLRSLGLLFIVLRVAAMAETAPPGRRQPSILRAARSGRWATTRRCPTVSCRRSLPGGRRNLWVTGSPMARGWWCGIASP